MIFRIYIRDCLLICILQIFVSCISYPDLNNANRLELPDYCVKDSLIEYTGFVISYDEFRKVPRWVAYELTANHTNGPFSRKDKTFRRDETVNLMQADDFDYKRSGWSRGHMAPAGDFRWSEKAIWDTFFYTNICPQNEVMNNNSWHILEKRVRFWAKKFGKIYVATGPVIGLNRFGVIGLNKIVVPDAFFKALLINKEGNYYAIGFYMENISESQSLKNCYMTIDELEELCGLNFFPTLDDSVENDIEASVNTNIWF